MEKGYIRKSHLRCLNYGVDKERNFSAKIIAGQQLADRLEKNRTLIEVATPFMEHLYNFVKGSNFFSILTDGEGCILKVIGDQEILQEAYSLKMIPGAFMDEKNIGTNAMGTALAEGKPVQVSGEEHYIKAYHRWTCSAAPIKNPDGEVIGCLDLTGYSPQVHSHTLGMVVAAVKAVENILTKDQATFKLSVVNKYIETIINSIDEGIITVGPKGYLKLLNAKAEKILGLSNIEIQGKRAKDYIENWDFIERILKEKNKISEEETYIKSKKGKFHCIISGYFIQGKDKPQGYVCIFKEIKTARKLANRMYGKQAVYTFEKIIGRNKEFIKTLEKAKNIADSPSTVLILGESGTGKEVFAQAIHNASSRKDEAFVAINCGAIPKNLIEAELFGYEEGAFTGGKRGGSIGKFELADGGTLFLDEIGEMPLDMQVNLLRVLEEGKFYKVGGNREISVDVRIIAATNKDLKKEVEKGFFRKDLYYRLNVLTLKLPSLKERKDDIPLLVDYFLTIKSLKLNKKTVVLGEEILEKFMNYHWPGNIRELENVIESIVNTPDLLELPFEKPNIKFSFDEQLLELENLEDVEKYTIEKVLKKYNYNISNAAKALGIGRNTLYRKVEKYKIKVEDHFCSNLKQLP
ncbi:sigma-54-dependent Fis family transcriptional regulator [Anaerobranca gottschalkii]|uniref:PAS domain S-box-containing protein n=1 Tax=Anaerobranca gottschalkii DSM 13577 TaxID=1120990 RepID=A0A1H9ZT65_9FIRM|nr:sigma 54-interacting transcriptional regulator [Anaerobranca gottschalkii]SES84948.1 PAS domain S-box-containing protein [Anaerobranca gottschalkii DSM 13577]